MALLPPTGAFAPPLIGPGGGRTTYDVSRAVDRIVPVVPRECILLVRDALVFVGRGSLDCSPLTSTSGFLDDASAIFE